MKTEVSSKLYLITAFFITFFITFGSVFHINAQPTDPNYSFRGPIITLPYEYGGLTFEFYMNPGETRCESFKLTNDFQLQPDNTSTSITYYTMPSDQEIDPETGIPRFPEKSLTIDHKYSLARWITFEDDSITIKNWGESKDVDFCVDVPADADPGSYYAALLLSTITKEEFLEEKDIEQTNSGAAIGSRLGPNIIVTVSGNTEENFFVEGMKVVDFENKEHFLNIFEYTGVRVQTTVKNEGNVIFRPAGNIFIHQGDLGSPIDKLKFNEDGRRVFPESIRLMENDWNPDAPLYYELNNEGDIEFKFDVNKVGDLKMGRYFATLQMTYYDSAGNFQRSNDYTVMFWIIPWRIILTIIVLILILVGIFYYRRKTSMQYVQTLNAKKAKIKRSK